MTGDIKGKKEEMEVKNIKQEDGEPMNAKMIFFSASAYLVAHTFSPLYQPAFTAINLGVTFWAVSLT